MQYGAAPSAAAAGVAVTGIVIRAAAKLKTAAAEKAVLRFNVIIIAR
jgi:hypothetical protein